MDVVFLFYPCFKMGSVNCSANQTLFSCPIWQAGAACRSHGDSPHPSWRQRICLIMATKNAAMAVTKQNRHVTLHFKTVSLSTDMAGPVAVIKQGLPAHS